MKNFTKYLLAILAGAIAGTLVWWGFDSFAANDAGYFVKIFLKSLVPVIVVVLLLSQVKKAGT
jgi:hypothetical protein